MTGLCEVAEVLADRGDTCCGMKDTDLHLWTNWLQVCPEELKSSGYYISPLMFIDT